MQWVTLKPTLNSALTLYHQGSNEHITHKGIFIFMALFATCCIEHSRVIASLQLLMVIPLLPTVLHLCPGCGFRTYAELGLASKPQIRAWLQDMPSPLYLQTLLQQEGMAEMTPYHSALWKLWGCDAQHSDSVARSVVFLQHWDMFDLLLQIVGCVVGALCLHYVNQSHQIGKMNFTEKVNAYTIAHACTVVVIQK